MGFFRDLYFGKKDAAKARGEKTERADIRGNDERKEIYDSKGHWVEEHRWNPEYGRWDKRDSRGTVLGHIETDRQGNRVHTDTFGRVTRIDKRKDARTVEHYDAKGRKIGYTTRDLAGNLTRHTFTDGKKR